MRACAHRPPSRHATHTLERPSQSDKPPLLVATLRDAFVAKKPSPRALGTSQVQRSALNTLRRRRPAAAAAAFRLAPGGVTEPPPQHVGWSLAGHQCSWAPCPGLPSSTSHSSSHTHTLSSRERRAPRRGSARRRFDGGAAAASGEALVLYTPVTHTHTHNAILPLSRSSPPLQPLNSARRTRLKIA